MVSLSSFLSLHNCIYFIKNSGKKQSFHFVCFSLYLTQAFEDFVGLEVLVQKKCFTPVFQVCGVIDLNYFETTVTKIFSDCICISIFFTCQHPFILLVANIFAYFSGKRKG